MCNSWLTNKKAHATVYKPLQVDIECDFLVAILIHLTTLTVPVEMSFNVVKTGKKFE